MNKRTGKIASLPKDLRELVNRMLENGAQHRSIINELEKHRHRWPDDMDDITESNMSNWHQGGYQDWLHEQEIQADISARRDYAATLIENAPENKTNEVVVQVGVNHLYHILATFDRLAYQAKSAEDPSTFCKVVNTLARLSRGAFDMQKYKDHVRERKQRIEAELTKAKTPGGLTDEAIAIMERELKLL